MIDILLGLGVLVIAAGVGFVVFMAREGRVRSTWLIFLAGFCSLGLLAMLVTDWPSEVMASFWAGHSVLAGVLSTVLMLGIGFLVFEVRDVREQEELNGSLTAAGMGGMVDHVVDVEVALALLCAEAPPSEHGWASWDRPDRPLRWLRENRSRLSRTPGGGPAVLDPRSWAHPLSNKDPGDLAWRTDLADQSVRRLLAAIRDWTPVIGRSRAGLQALISIAELRNGLMSLEAQLERGEVAKASAQIVLLRWRCRVLAYALESASHAPELRPEVLVSAAPLDGGSSILDRPTYRWIRNDWEHQLTRAARVLERGPA